MRQPPLEELLKRVDNRYTLVVAAAKRARQILEGAEPLVNIDSNKPVSIALAEVAQGKVTCQPTKEGSE